jgi:uncharacterized protein YxjI
MAMPAKPGERYTIRQKVFKIFGAAFHIYDNSGVVIGYCKQKAFRLREKLVLFTDERASQELLTIQARTILDFGTTYDVDLPSGARLGSVRRKGLSSLVRDEWEAMSPDGTVIGRLREDSMGLALARRFLPAVALVVPQKLELHAADGRRLATYRTHFNLFVYRLGVTVHEDGVVDEMLLLAIGFLIAAIEGRQGNEGSGSGLFSGS